MPAAAARAWRAVGAAFNLFNTILGGGVGMVPMPFVLRSMGLAWAPKLLVISAGWAAYASYALMQASFHCGATTYGGVARRTLGTLGASLLSMNETLLLFGSTVICLQILGDVAPNVVTISRALAVVMAGVVVAPMVMFVRRIEHLSPLSALASAAVAAFVAFVVAAALAEREALQPLTSLEHTPTARALLDGTSTIVLCFLHQFNVLPIYHTLPDPSPAMFLGIVGVAVGLSLAVYLTVGVLACLTLGDRVSDDILEDYWHSKGVGAQVCVGLLALAQLLTVPLFAFEAVTELSAAWVRRLAGGRVPHKGTVRPRDGSGGEDAGEGEGEDERLLGRRRQRQQSRHSTTALAEGPGAKERSSDAEGADDHVARAPAWVFQAVGAAWCGAATALAVVAPDTGKVFALIGALCGVPLMCILPPLMLARCSPGPLTAAANGLLAAFGTLVMVGCTVSAVWAFV